MGLAPNYDQDGGSTVASMTWREFWEGCDWSERATIIFGASMLPVLCLVVWVLW
jgi:hypothetical protein